MLQSLLLYTWGTNKIHQINQIIILQAIPCVDSIDFVNSTSWVPDFMIIPGTQNNL